MQIDIKMEYIKPIEMEYCALYKNYCYITMVELHF